MSLSEQSEDSTSRKEPIPMPKNFNRRHFLQGTLAAVGAAAASGVALPQAVQARSTDRELCTMIDLSKCQGCEACVEACWDANEKYKPVDVKKPFPKMFPAKVPVEDWSEQQNVSDRLTPYNWLYIQRAYVEKNGETLEVNMPRRCMHCVNPPCVNLCPFGAASKSDNGIVNFDPDLCFGGAKCRSVCPWNIPQRQTGVGLYLDVAPMFAGNGVMYKCNRCYERLAEGDQPACMEACEYGVQIIGPRDEILIKAHIRAKEIGGYIYGEHENGGTNTIYVSPVPFEELNRQIDQETRDIIADNVKNAMRKNQDANDAGELKMRIARKVRMGRPHFSPVENTMASSENLTKAVLLAPVAGLALAVGKMRKIFKDRNGDNQQ
jgi:formate dehydrogenase iron-sulfur subunit